jgi:misacylated tRNA(Ala) deacylase
MSIHTAQHLVSAVFETQGIPTLSWSLTAHPSPSYIQTNVRPTADQIADVQSRADHLVRQNTRVFVEVEALEEDAFRAGKIPADYTGGVKRTIEIEGVERDL